MNQSNLLLEIIEKRNINIDPNQSGIFPIQARQGIGLEISLLNKCFKDYQ